MERRLTERGRERRQQILEFATQTFAEKGFHPTSVTEITDGLGVGKGVFYWYFESKDELFAEILRESQRSLRRRQAKEIGDETDPIRRLEVGLSTAIFWFSENPALLTLRDFAATEPRWADAIRKGQAIAVDDLAEMVSEAIDRGQVAPGDPTLLAHAMLGAANQVVRFVLEEGDGRDVAMLASLTVRFCLGGLGVSYSSLGSDPLS